MNRDRRITSTFRALVQTLFFLVLMATLIGSTIRLLREQNRRDEVRSAEKAATAHMEEQLEAVLRQSKLSAAELSAWMMQASPYMQKPVHLDTLHPDSPPESDAPLTKDDWVRALFDGLYERFASELRNPGRNGLIFFGTADGSLLAAGTYGDKDAIDTDRISFCDVVLGPDARFEKGDYFEFLVPAGKNDVVSTFLRKLDRTPASTRPKHFDLRPGSNLINNFQLLNDPAGCQPWLSAEVKPHGYSEKLGERLSARARKVDPGGKVYDATGRQWYKTGLAAQSSKTATTVYGLFELFDGIDWVAASLRAVHLEFSGGPSVDGVVAVSLSHSYLETQLENALGRLEPNPYAKPLAAVLFAPEESGAVTVPAKPAPENAPATKGKEPAESPLTDRQENQLVFALNSAANPDQPKNFEKMRRDLARMLDDAHQANPEWEEDSLSKPISNLHWPGVMGGLRCEARFVNVKAGNLSLPWKVGLIFPDSTQDVAVFSEDPFRWFTGKTGLPGFFLPLVSLIGAAWCFLRLRESRLMLIERDAARAVAEANAAASRTVLFSAQEHHAQRIREMQEAEENRNQISIRHQAGMERAQKEVLAERERHYAQKIESLDRRRERTAWAGYAWAYKNLDSFSHEIRPLISMQVKPEIILDYIADEIQLAEALLGHTTKLLREKILTAADVRAWIGSSATVLTESPFQVLTQKHIVRRIVLQLVRNANKAQPNGEVFCHVGTETVLPLAEKLPPTAPPAPEPAPTPTAAPAAEAKTSGIRRFLLGILGLGDSEPPAPPAAVEPPPEPPTPPVAAEPPPEPPAVPEEDDPSVAPVPPGFYFVAKVRNLSLRLRQRPPDEREQIFQLFNDIAFQSGGTGMGLHSSRELARMAHGDLVLRDGASDDEVRFELWLPASLPEASGAEATPQKLPASGGRDAEAAYALSVLVLDDDAAVLRQTMQGLAANYTARGMDDPASFLEAVLQSAQIAVLDYDLGNQRTGDFPDGLAVARWLRENSYRGLLVLHTNQTLSPAAQKERQELHMIPLSKHGSSALGEQLQQAEFEWAQDVTPAWRATDFAALEEAADRAGVPLRHPELEAFRALLDGNITDPILHRLLWLACERCDSTAVETILHRFLPHLCPE